MSKVTRIYQSDARFLAEMTVNGCRLVFGVSKKEMRAGKPLNAAKNEWVRTVLGSTDLIDPDSLKATAKEAVVLLRDEIETFFEEETRDES